jgi:PAS domain S-box-containing protein
MTADRENPSPLGASFRLLARIAAGVVISLGTLVLVGWLLDIRVLKSIYPTWISMKSNTAVTFMLAGACLLLNLRDSAGAARERVADICAALTLLGGLLTVAEYLSGLDLGIDHVPIPEQAGAIATTYPGRMAVTTALNCALAGGALLLFRRRRGWLVQGPALLVGAFSLVAIAGYFFDVENLKRIGPQFSAVHTAIGFFILSAGMLLGQQRGGLMRLVGDTGPAGLMLRRLLPILLGVPFVLGWAILFGTRLGLYGVETGWAVYCVATVVILTIAISRSASTVHRVDRALVEANATLRAVLESANAPIYSVDRDLRYTNFNHAHAEAMRSLAGARIATGGNALDYLTVPEDREATRRNLERALQGETHVASFSSADRGPAQRYFEIFHNPIRGASGEVLGVSVFAHDVTIHMQAEAAIRSANVDLERRVAERTAELAAANDELASALESIRESEARYQQTQRLQSLGVLAGGIAHDFNNILMAILGNSELAAGSIPAGSPAHRNLGEIGKATQRGADLCRQMLAYAGKGRAQLAPLDLSEVILEMRDMLQMAISKKATLRLELASGLPAVEADVAQLRQVVMNLVINASEAIGDADGLITTVTNVLDCDRGYLDVAWSGEQLPEGRYVYLEVSDTGVGMDEATRARIFEPFFTTKFTGRGLGLSAVNGIVQAHKGAIRVYSEPGRGTTFKLLLPASAAAPRRLGAAKDECGEYRGSGTVLVVDDEESVRNVARGMLEQMGFCVLTAADGREAVETYRARRDDIVCVLLDLTMPKMDGEETFRRIRLIDPSAVVLLSSGYSEQLAVQQFVGRGLAGFIQKPYQLSTLELKLGRVLGGDPTSRLTPPPGR